MRSTRLTIRVTVVAAVAGLMIALAVAVPAQSTVKAGARAAAGAKQATTPIYQDRSYSYAERAADLVSRMTLAQKASQMNSSYSPAIPSLGVPQWGWWNEALHGVAREQLLNNANATTLTNTTSYPDDQSLGSTWDPSLIYTVASAISDEAREVVTNNTENLDFYSPTMNLERDPRWGRTDEAYGEDPFLVSQEVSQFVDGLQGENQHGQLLPQSGGYYKTIATIKHFAANNSEVNRLTGSSDMDDRTLREYYTKAFRDVVAQAKPGSVMSAYNEVNGTPTPPISISTTRCCARPSASAATPARTATRSSRSPTATTGSRRAGRDPLTTPSGMRSRWRLVKTSTVSKGFTMASTMRTRCLPRRRRVPDRDRHVQCQRHRYIAGAPVRRANGNRRV